MAYNKHTWGQGDVITTKKMNEIEDALELSRQQLEAIIDPASTDSDEEEQISKVKEINQMSSRINNMIIINENPPTDEQKTDNKLWINTNEEQATIEILSKDEVQRELDKKMSAMKVHYKGTSFNTNNFLNPLPVDDLFLYSANNNDLFSSIATHYDQCIKIPASADITNVSTEANNIWIFTGGNKKRLVYWVPLSQSLETLVSLADGEKTFSGQVSSPNLTISSALGQSNQELRIQFNGHEAIPTKIGVTLKNWDFQDYDDDQCFAAYQEYVQSLGDLYIWCNSSVSQLVSQVYTTFSIQGQDKTYTYGTTVPYTPLITGDKIDYNGRSVESYHDFYILAPIIDAESKQNILFTQEENKDYFISTTTYDKTHNPSSIICSHFTDSNATFTIDGDGHLRFYPNDLEIDLQSFNQIIKTSYEERQPIKLIVTNEIKKTDEIEISATLSDFPAQATCTDYIELNYFSDQMEIFHDQLENFLSVNNVIQEVQHAQQNYYISPLGDDVNNGYSADAPKATINSALEAGAQKIFLASGIYTEQIDLSKSQYNKIELYHYNPTRQKDKKVLFLPTNYIISGFNKKAEASSDTVYFTTITDTTLQNALSNNAYIWLFHENTIDTAALIDNTDETSVTQQYIERHSLQKGQTSRRLERRFQRINSLLENGVFKADKLMLFSQQEGVWFYDSDTHQLYISSINPIDDEHPICGSYKVNQNLFKLSTEQRNNFTIIADGIDVKYERFNLDYTINSHITNCTCKNVYGTNCFSYNGANQVTLEKCEASCAYYSNNHGDGISATGLSSNGTMLNASSAHLIDCWSHDNLDDGFSDHIGCSSVIDGGLFEYNWYGGGITPSHGSLCICRNTIAQKNGQAGFLYRGRAALTEQQEGAQFECSNCISNDNGYWGGGEKGATNQMIGGFVVDGTADGRDLNTLSDAYVTARFNSCVAVNEIRGFAAVRQGNAIVTNCYASNCQNDTYIGAATSTDKAGSLDVVELTPLYDPNKSIDKILEDIAEIQTDLSDTKANLNDVSNNVQQINSVLSKDTGTETPTSLLNKQKEYVGNYTNGSGAWANLTDTPASDNAPASYYRFVLIPVTHGQQITLSRPSGERSGLYQFFAGMPSFNEQNQPISGTNNRADKFIIGDDTNKKEYTTERTDTVPSATDPTKQVYLFLMTHYNTSDVRPNKLIINGVDYLVVPEAGINPLQEYIAPEVQNIMQPAINTLTNKTNVLTTQNENRIKEVENLQKEVSGIISPLIQQYEVHDGYINTSSTIKKWVIPNSSSADLEALKAYQYIIIPVQTNDEIQIQRYDLDSIYNRSLYLLISEYDTPVNDQVVTPAIDGQTIQEAGTTIQSFIVPKDCYLYILVKRDNVDRTPTLLTINGIDYIHPVSDLNYHISWNEQMQPPYEYCLENILCIGDSLTMGSYPEYNTPPGWSGGSHFIQQNYPYFLSRMLNTNVTNAGFSGFSAYDWWHGAVEKSWARPQYTYSDYDVVTIWLGTNKGLDNSYQTSADETIYPLETPYDAENNTGFYIENPSITYPDTRPENERIPLKWNTNTQVGCYCQIIEEILHDNPKALIILLTTFAGNSSNGTATAPRHLPKEDTARIYEIANHFHLPVVSLSDLQYSIHPEFHGEPTEVTKEVNGEMVTTVKTDKTHLKKTGHLFVANRIIKTIREWIAEDVTRGEFGIHRRNDIDSIPKA